MSLFGGGKNPDVKPADPASPKPAAPAPAAPSRAAATTATSTVCVIGPKTLVKGEVTGDEDVVVDGTVEGQIRITRDLRIGNGGIVRATVEAQSIVISGEVVGDCGAATRVEIQATGRVTGNLRAPRIVIAEGAMFKGTSDMSPRKDDRKDKAAAG